MPTSPRGSSRTTTPSSPARLPTRPPPSCPCSASTSPRSCVSKRTASSAPTTSSPWTRSPCTWPNSPVGAPAPACASPCAAMCTACSRSGTARTASAAMTRTASHSWAPGRKTPARMCPRGPARPPPPSRGHVPVAPDSLEALKTERTDHVSKPSGHFTCQQQAESSPEQAGQRHHAEDRDDGARAAIHPSESRGSQRRAHQSHAHAEEEPPDRGAEKDAQHHDRRGAIAAHVPSQPEPREDRREGDDRGGVRESEREGRRPRRREPARADGRSPRVARHGRPRSHAQVKEKDAAYDLKPEALFHECVRHQGEAEGGHRPVERVGGGGAEPGGKADGASVGQGATDAQHADGPDGRGDGEADDQAPEEGGGIHRARTLSREPDAWPEA